MSCRIFSFCLMAVCGWAQFPVLPSSPRMLPTDASEGPLAASGEAFSPDPLEQRLDGPNMFPAGIISTEELARPVSRKGVKLLEKAQDHSRSGEHDKAIEELRLALQEPSAVPYAHSILGAEYLRTGRVAEAVIELEVAVQLLPHNAPNRSNFGFALYLAGERERGEQEVRKALVLDSGNSKTRHVLNVIERGRGQ